MGLKTMDPRKIAKQIGIPLAKWPGNCYVIAVTFVDKKIVAGKACYGVWTGPIAFGSTFYGRPFTHHGWVELDNNKICDPTRYVFEAVSPYVYVGVNDHYDIAGIETRMKMHSKKAPADDKSTRLIEFPEIPEVVNLLGEPPYYWNRLLWLANLSPDMFGFNASIVYTALQQAGLKCLIPIDSWRLIMEDK